MRGCKLTAREIYQQIDRLGVPLSERRQAFAHYCCSRAGLVDPMIFIRHGMGQVKSISSARIPQRLRSVG